MSHIKYLFFILTALFLVGCSTTKTTTIDVQPAKVVQVQIPEELLKPCVPEKPADKQTYLSLAPHQREEYLTDYSIKLIGTIRVCNDRIKQIKTLNQAN